MEHLFHAIFFAILCVTNASIPTNSSNNATTPLTTLYIGALFDLETKDGYGSLPMAEQAIEEINNNSNILPGYRLQLMVNSTRGSYGFGQKVLHEFLTTGPRKIMLLGPGQNSLAKSVAAYAGIPEVSLLQFSYGTSDLELASRRDLYPNFFRTTTSLASLDAPRIEFIKEYGWDEVGIIYGDNVQYFKLSNQLANRLKQNKIKVLAEVRLQANDPTRAIRTVKDKGIHVILGLFSLDAVARKMICEAYRQKMYGPHYVWMLINSQNNGWWIPGKNEESACSDLEMKCQIQNHFSFYHTKVIFPGKRFYDYANKNGTQIVSDYRAKVDNGSDTSNRSSIFLNVYDAVWSIALVLDQSRDELLKQGKSLENLTYRDTNATAVFRRQAKKLDFPTPNIGTRVRYYANGDRKNTIVLKQLVIVDGKFRTVSAGKFDVETNKLAASSEIHWFAGTPYTKTTETYTYRTIDRTLVIALVVFASLGILYALFCLLTLVLNFKKKIVQNSGPVISILIIIGCILNYVTVILYGFDYSRVSPETVTRLCRARSWTFAIGFTLSVGGLAAKLWIAYSVLKDRFVRSRIIMMFWMLGILVLFFIVDVIILACWETRDPLHRALKQVRSQPEYKCFQPITADTFRADIEVVEHCDCADLTLWLVVILVFKVVILLTGGFLAWQTRRVYIPSLNDTQHCASCVFVVVLFCLVGSIVAFTTTMYPSAYYGVIGALIIIATTLILVLLFTNKIVRLSCRRKRTKTLRTGEASANNNKYSCPCGAACAQFWSFCGCSSACCISCCSCFPCWKLYSCFRSIFYGSQVHPKATGGEESKAEFYIGGVTQDKDAEIIYLKNELREKNTQLSNLGHNRTVKSNWTQTIDDGSYVWNRDDSDSMISDGNGSDLESSQDSETRQRFRRTANKFRIFNEAIDYSHVRSKVDTGMRKTSLGPSSPQPRRGSRMSVYSSDEDVRKLKTTLAQKDEEIIKLRKELEGLKPRHLAAQQQERSQLEQNPSPNMQTIVLIETPATPVPPEDEDDLTTTIVQQPVTSSPSKAGDNVNEITPTRGVETTSGKQGVEVKTQDRSKKKSSLGPGGYWLLKEETDSIAEDYKHENKVSGKDSKDSSKTKEDEKKSEKNASRKDSRDNRKIASKVGQDSTTEKNSTSSQTGSGLHDKGEIIGDNNTTATTKSNAEEILQTSLTQVVLSQSLSKATEKASTAIEDEYNKKQTEGSILDKIEEDDTTTVSKDEETNEEKDETIAKNSEEKSGNKQEETKVKKKSVHRKISSWLFGDKEDEDVNKSDTEKDKNGQKMDKKENKENKAGKDNQGSTSDAKVTETKAKHTEINRSDGGDKDPLLVGDNNDETGKVTGVDNNVLEPNSDKVNDDTSKDELNGEAKKQEDNAREDGDGGNMGMIDEESEDEYEDDSADDDDDDDGDDDDDNDEGEDQHKNGETRTGATKGAAGRRGSKKGRGRRKKIVFGKLKWKAQSKVDTGSGNYKRKASEKKIPHYKTDYSHVKSRVSSLSEANTVSEKAVESPSTQRRQRSVSFNKTPDYSSVRPRLYNGTTRRYNSEMPSTLPK